MDQKNGKNEMFTDEEKVVLGALPKKYKWIARDGDGSIYVYADKPQRGERVFKFQDGYKPTSYHNINIFKHIFKGVTWVNSPVRFREEPLDDVEREYLKAVLKPFHKKVCWVLKTDVSSSNFEYLYIKVKHYGRIDFLNFPVFKKGKMYKGMKLNSCYSLEELGITYE